MKHRFLYDGSVITHWNLPINDTINDFIRRYSFNGLESYLFIRIGVFIRQRESPDYMQGIKIG